MVTMADKDDEKTTSVRCYVKIRSNPIKAIIDTGAAVSIMTRSLMKKLNLKIEEASNIIVMIANRKRERALGLIRDVPIVVQGILIPITLQIIESTNDTLLLGTDWCRMTKANIDFESEEMQIKYRGRVTNVTISFESLKISIPKDYEYDDEIDEMLEEEEYEEKSDLEERESFHLN